MHQKALPLVGEMTPQNEQLYRNTGLPVVTVFTRMNHADKVNEQVFQDLLKQVRAVAVKFTKLKFRVADAKAYLKDMDQKFGFEQTITENSLSVGLREGSVYYTMPQEEFSAKLMEQFVQDFLDGKLEGIEQVKYEPATHDIYTVFNEKFLRLCLQYDDHSKVTADGDVQADYEGTVDVFVVNMQLFYHRIVTICHTFFIFD